MENEKKKSLIFIHGFKKHKENIFQSLEEKLLQNDFFADFKIINLNYYDNLDKKSINNQLFKTIIIDKLEELKDEDVFIVGYSVGGLVSLTLTQKYPNIKKIVALAPVYKIAFFSWPTKIINNYKTSLKIKKKVGKERYQRLKLLQKKGISEKYPIRITTQINYFRLKIRKQTKKLKEKDILIIFSINDNINNLTSSLKWFNKNFNYSDNKLQIHFSEETHNELISKKAKSNHFLIENFLISEFD